MRTALMAKTRRARGGRPRTTEAGEEMMTTVTLPVSLMVRVKLEAVRRRTSFKALVVEGLRLVLARATKGERT
jgi:hypothetical protein